MHNLKSIFKKYYEIIFKSLPHSYNFIENGKKILNIRKKMDFQLKFKMEIFMKSIKC